LNIPNKTSIKMLVVLMFLITSSYINAQQENILVSPKEAFKLITNDTNIVILDVRTIKEFNSETGKLKGAILLPVNELDDRIKELDQFKERHIIVYCRTGHRSGIASKILSKHGFKVFNIEGGINRWKEEQLPVLK